MCVSRLRRSLLVMMDVELREIMKSMILLIYKSTMLKIVLFA